MKITVFGVEKDLPRDVSVAAALALLGEPVEHVIVEVNGLHIRPSQYGSVTLAEADRLEIIYPAFGG